MSCCRKELLPWQISQILQSLQQTEHFMTPSNHISIWSYLPHMTAFHKQVITQVTRSPERKDLPNICDIFPHRDFPMEVVQRLRSLTTCREIYWW